MTFQIQEAERIQEPGRILVAGPSKSGKTWGALNIALILAGGEPVGVIDTENRSARKYAKEYSSDIKGELNFRLIELPPPFTPERYVEAAEQLIDSGIGALVVDSTTHEWDGEGGCLEIHDNEAARTGNSWTAWGPVNPRHKRFLEKVIVRSPVHVIGTARAKMEYAQTKGDDGKTKIVKLGMGPIQRGQFEFEWDIFCELDLAHTLTVTGSRCRAVDGQTYKKDIKTFAETVREWLKGGKVEDRLTNDQELRALVELGKEHDKNPDEIMKLSQKMYEKGPRELKLSEYNELLKQLRGEV